MQEVFPNLRNNVILFPKIHLKSYIMHRFGETRDETKSVDVKSCFFEDGGKQDWTLFEVNIT